MSTKANVKNYKTAKFVGITLLITVIAAVLVAGTFAKYTSEATGVATATVAKWDIKAGVQGEEVSITGDNATVAFNLFDTILEEDGNDEYDVIRDENGKVLKIAPGTSGAFDLSIVNDSEVTAAYTVEFLVEGAEVPFEFNVNNTGWTTSLENVGETVIEMGTSKVVNVEWKWAFEGDDAVDTALGIAAEDVTVTATLNVNQYDDSEGTTQDPTDEPVEDLDAYALLTVSSDSAYQYLPEDAVGIPDIVSPSKNLYLEAGTTITASENYGFYIMTQTGEEITQLSSGHMGAVDGMEAATDGTYTINTAGWYGIAIRNSDSSAFDTTEALGTYVTFSK